MTTLKQKEVRGRREGLKDEGNWCTVNRGGRAVEATEGNWARMFEACNNKAVDVL